MYTAGRPRGEARARVRQNRVVLAVECYGQAFAEMFASPTGRTASSIREATGAIVPRSPGRVRHKSSTHCAGKAGRSAAPVCRCASVFAQCARRTAGAKPAPGLPCALSTRGGPRKPAKLGHFVPRERQIMCGCWCCRTGLNCRPLPYQGSALPLSYGSRCWRRIGPRHGPAKRAMSATSPPAAQACRSREIDKSAPLPGRRGRFAAKRLGLVPKIPPADRPLGGRYEIA